VLLQNIKKYNIWLKYICLDYYCREPAAAGSRYGRHKNQNMHCPMDEYIYIYRYHAHDDNIDAPYACIQQPNKIKGEAGLMTE